jgi:hypothetical protein
MFYAIKLMFKIYIKNISKSYLDIARACIIFNELYMWKLL